MSGMSVKSGEMVKMTVRVPEGFWKKLKLAAVEADVSLGEFLVHMLEDRERRLEKVRRLQPSPLHRVDVDG